MRRMRFQACSNHFSRKGNGLGCVTVRVNRMSRTRRVMWNGAWMVGLVHPNVHKVLGEVDVSVCGAPVTHRGAYRCRGALKGNRGRPSSPLFQEVEEGALLLHAKYRMRPTPSLCWWITGNPSPTRVRTRHLASLRAHSNLRLMVAFVLPCALKVLLHLRDLGAGDVGQKQWGLKYCNTRCANCCTVFPALCTTPAFPHSLCVRILRVYAVRVIHASAFIMVRAFTASSRVSTVVVTRFAPLPTLTRYFEPRCVMPLLVRFINTPSRALTMPHFAVAILLPACDKLTKWNTCFTQFRIWTGIFESLGRLSVAKYDITRFYPHILQCLRISTPVEMVFDKPHSTQRVYVYEAPFHPSYCTRCILSVTALEHFWANKCVHFLCLLCFNWFKLSVLRITVSKLPGYMFFPNQMWLAFVTASNNLVPLRSVARLH